MSSLEVGQFFSYFSSGRPRKEGSWLLDCHCPHETASSEHNRCLVCVTSRLFVIWGRLLLDYSAYLVSAWPVSPQYLKCDFELVSPFSHYTSTGSKDTIAEENNCLGGKCPWRQPSQEYLHLNDGRQAAKRPDAELFLARCREWKMRHEIAHCWKMVVSRWCYTPGPADKFRVGIKKIRETQI